jgi:hypothetical protein
MVWRIESISCVVVGNKQRKTGSSQGLQTSAFSCDDSARTLITENRMLRKGPTLAKNARMGRPNFKAKGQVPSSKTMFKGQER